MPDAGRTVISNTSPLYYLHRVTCLDLLQAVYGCVTITPDVLAELAAGAAQGEDVPDVSIHDWIRVRQIAVPAYLALVPDLGAGEASVLALAAETPNCTVIMDDRLGRRMARRQGVRLTGTVGLLLKAKNGGLVPSIAPLLDDLARAGFYLGEAFRFDVLSLAGES